MNQSNLYVPNPQKWIDYFTKSKKTQVGKGLYIPSKTSSMEPDSMSVKVVSPAEQTLDQAKSELKRDGINSSEITSLIHKRKNRRTVNKSKVVGKTKQLKKTYTSKRKKITGKKISKSVKKGRKTVKKVVKNRHKIAKNSDKNRHKRKVSKKLKKPITTWDIFGS